MAMSQAPRAARSTATLAGLLLLGACASGPQVQTLATGRSDVSAYALSGDDLAQLRRAALGLCPLGGEVVRQSARGDLAEPLDGRWRQALQATAHWFDPPQRSAQLVVLCREPGDGRRLAPSPVAGGKAAAAATAADAAAAPAAPSSPATEVTAAALPVGPITPEW